jgi:radical SAM superfamily enzyme YgiQ (UPF0313 family)
MDKKRFKRLAPMLHELDIEFRCSISSVLLNDEICELLYYAGCREVGIGFESADDDILKLMKKAGKATTNMHQDAVKVIQKHGMRCKIFIISGLPGETAETVEATKQFVLTLNPDKWINTLFTPYPGTPVFNNPEFYGVEILHKRFSEYIQSYPSKSIINLFDKETKEVLVTHKQFEQRFEDLYNWLNEHNPESYEYSSFNG